MNSVTRLAPPAAEVATCSYHSSFGRSHARCYRPRPSNFGVKQRCGPARCHMSQSADQRQSWSSHSTAHFAVTTAATVLLGITLTSFITALPAHAASCDTLSSTGDMSPREVFSLASEEDFWSNLVQYARFFVSVLAGTAYVAFKPVAGLMKRPVSAIGVIVFTAAFLFFVRATLLAMLGTTDPVNPFEPL